MCRRTVRICFVLGIALLSAPSSAQAQALEPTAGPAGAALGGVVEYEGDVLASGVGIGAFRRVGGVWAAEPVPLRLGTLYRLGGTLIAQSNTVLYRSTDGTTWTRAWDRTDVAVDIAAVDGDSLLVLANDSLFVSGDGVAWRSLIRGRVILDEDGEATENTITSLLAATRTPDGTLWASASGATQFGAFRSLDGETWEFVSPGQFDFPRTLYATTAGDLFMILDSEVLRYDAATEAWEPASEGLDAASPLGFVEANGALFVRVQTASGTALRRLAGAAWEPVTLPVDSVLAIAPADGGLLVIGEERLFRGPGDGTWTAIDDGLAASFARPFALGSDVVASTRDGWVRSADEGATWEPVGFPTVRAVYDFGGVAFGTGADDVHRTTDGGESWQTVNEGIDVGFFHNRRIRDMAAHEGAFYGGLFSNRGAEHNGGEVVGGVYRSTDGGLSWELFGSGYPTNEDGFPVGVFHIAATADYLIAATEEGLVRIAHDGSGWESLASPAPNPGSVSDLSVAEGWLFLTTVRAVFASDDSGATWTELADGLPDGDFFLALSLVSGAPYALLSPSSDPITGLYRFEGDAWVDTGVAVPDWARFLDAAPAGEYLFFGTGNHGVWRVPVEELVVAAEPSVAAVRSPTLAPAYPNPAGGATTLRLSLPEAAEVRVEAFDVLGRRVAVLHDGRVEANAGYPLEFETAGLAAGVYLVRVTGDGLSLDRRVTVVR